MRRKRMLMLPIGILAVTLVSFIGGQLVMQLWNWLLPPIFGWRQVTFWQALGLLALCRILFGGRGFSRSNSRDYTPEQRERFRHAVRKRFGFDPSPARARDDDASSATL